MSTVYTIDGRQGKFKITGRGSKNHRVANIETGHTELVEVNLLKPYVNQDAPANIKEKFTALENLVKVVASKHANGLFLSGPGGTGKTHTVMHVVREMGLEEGCHFVVCKGYTTPAGLFQFLKEHSDKLVIFDDCDQVFKDQTGLNILKAVLDTYPIRMVSWNTSEGEEDNKFIFTGQIIFISNVDLESQQSAHLKAVVTRVLAITLGATREEVLVRMQDLIPVICEHHDEETQNEIRDFILDNSDHWPSPSLRVLVHLNSLVQWARKNNGDWQSLALSIDV